MGMRHGCASGRAAVLCYSAPMQSMRRQLRHLTWLALVAMLGLALVPTLSHALNAGANSAPWTEVCSTSASDTPRDAPGAPAASHGQHCPLCSAFSDAAALPQGAAVLRLDTGHGLFVAAAASATPSGRGAWPDALPRAPPRLS